MKEIDQMLDQWIHNSIVRAKLRSLIVSAIHTHTKTVVETSDHKLNTNEDGQYIQIK